MNANEIPICPQRSYVTLTEEDAVRVFGANTTLCGRERVEVVQTGKVLTLAEVQHGEHSMLFLEGSIRSATRPIPLRLRGPMGFIELRESRPIPSLLKLPAGLATAWNLSSGDVATLAVGSMAVRAMVTSSDRLYLEIDHSIVGASGSQCGNARWLPGIEWETTIETVEVPQPERSQTNRLITENDVRRARMQRQTIEIGKGQLITPAARSLGEELGVIRHGGNSR